MDNPDRPFDGDTWDTHALGLRISNTEPLYLEGYRLKDDADRFAAFCQDVAADESLLDPVDFSKVDTESIRETFQEG